MMDLYQIIFEYLIIVFMVQNISTATMMDNYASIRKLNNSHEKFIPSISPNLSKQILPKLIGANCTKNKVVTRDASKYAF